MAPDDAELIRSYRAGDPDAFEALVRRYQRPLATYLYRMTGSRAAADDLFQETFLRVLRGLPGYDERGKFSSWLFGIATNVASDAWRRNRGWREQVTSDPEAVDPDPAPMPDVEAERRDILEKIESALPEIPLKQRRVFLLRQHTDLTFRKIAELLDEPLNTVLGHMRYATIRLRRALDLD